MPDLRHIATVLEKHQGRFDYLDAFVDDVAELKKVASKPEARVVRVTPVPVLQFVVDGVKLLVEVYSEQGIARFRLADREDPPLADVGASAGAFVGGLIAAALMAAGRSKAGLLGGIIIGILVGAMIGESTQLPIERVRALQFDPATQQWRLYDGPLLTWAKRTLLPAPTLS